MPRAENRPEKIKLHNIRFEEIGPFYDSLTWEKEWLGNPLRFPLEFVTGIRVDNELVAMGGLEKSRFLHLAFRIVRADFQGRGLSGQLKADIDDYAREKGYSFYVGEIWKGNPALGLLLRYEGGRLVYNGDLKRLAYPVNRKGELIVRFLPLVFYTYLPAKSVISRILFFRR